MVTLNRIMSIKLDQLVAAMQRIAPLEYAESWDNVGLLVEPVRPRRIERVLLTIDLTEPVMDEAVSEHSSAIIAYHPPIFQPLKRLTTGVARQRTIGRALEHRIAIYSPHTALDAVPGGLCDWLCEGLGPVKQTRPINPAQSIGSSLSRKLVVFVPVDHVDRLRAALAAIPGVGQIGDYSHCSYNSPGYGTFLGNQKTNPTVGQRGRLERADEVRMEMVCPAGALPTAAQVIARAHPYEEPAWEAYPLAELPMPDRGAGRIARLARSVSLKTLVGRVKKHLGLWQVRVAPPCGKRGLATAYDQVAVCPGAGGSLFESVGQPMVLLTGEMRHHDVLSHTEAGRAVILTDHTNTERGYLKRLARRLGDELASAGGAAVDLAMARSDHDPLRSM
jgi:dinuclear metal center YbgI/SA1388 family protein